MALSAEELAMFGEVPPQPEPEPAPNPAAASLLAGIIPPDTAATEVAAPPPEKVKKKRKLEAMPACSACGTDLNPDNASQRPDSSWKHIGCPLDAARAAAAAPATPSPNTQEQNDAAGKAAFKAGQASVAAPTEASKAKAAADIADILGRVRPASVVQFELGPKTIAVLEALISKLP